MSARDDLVNTLVRYFVTEALEPLEAATRRSNALVDGFAHELAEKQRSEGHYWSDGEARGFFHAADFIDPEVEI